MADFHSDTQKAIKRAADQTRTEWGFLEVPLGAMTNAYGFSSDHPINVETNTRKAIEQIEILNEKLFELKHLLEDINREAKSNLELEAARNNPQLSATIDAIENPFNI